MEQGSRVAVIPPAVMKVLADPLQYLGVPWPTLVNLDYKTFVTKKIR